MLGVDIGVLLFWIVICWDKGIVVLVFGDLLFYGIGICLVVYFGIEQVCIISGISVVQYLCVQVGIDMNDMWLISSYGCCVSFDQLVSYCKVVMVMDVCCGL